jgi:hypothetical protein
MFSKVLFKLRQGVKAEQLEELRSGFNAMVGKIPG